MTKRTTRKTEASGPRSIATDTNNGIANTGALLFAFVFNGARRPLKFTVIGLMLASASLTAMGISYDHEPDRHISSLQETSDSANESESSDDELAPYRKRPVRTGMASTPVIGGLLYDLQGFLSDTWAHSAKETTTLRGKAEEKGPEVARKSLPKLLELLKFLAKNLR